MGRRLGTRDGTETGNERWNRGWEQEGGIKTGEREKKADLKSVLATNIPLYRAFEWYENLQEKGV